MAMEDNPTFPMERPYQIIRRSIYTFLQHYHYFTSTAALLVFPFSVSLLLSQTFSPSSSLLITIHDRLRSLFNAAGFPPSSDFFSLLNLKLSQTISCSIFSLPFTWSFLLIAKAYVIKFLNQQKLISPLPISSFITLYNPLLLTYVYNSFVILSANATAFSLLSLAFNCLQGFGFSSPNGFLFVSAAGAILYSIILANVLVICNLALISSGMDGCGGYLAILKACVLIGGRTSTALFLALPVNLALAGVEALFQYRVVRSYHLAEKPNSSLALEGLFIAYLYSILLVLDTIVSCMFFKSCKMGCLIVHEDRYSYRIEIGEEDGMDFANEDLKGDLKNWVLNETAKRIVS